MGLVGRISNVLRQKASALIDAARDPAAQVEALIEECKEHMKSATAELLSYKASEKLLAQKSGELAASAMAWRQRAEAAVRAGDDPLAREALVEERRVSEQHHEVEKERREMGAYAAELLRGRRALQERLQELELRKGSIAQNLASARAGGASVLAAEGRAWDAMERAEARISDDAALAEVDAMLADPLAERDAAVEAKLREAMKQAAAEQALAELKKKMRS
jgi:phage shock protein A